MPIEFRCTQCDKLLRTGDDTAGKQAKCPECGTVMTVPVPDPEPVSPTQPMGSFEAASPFGAAPAQTPLDSMNPYQSPASIGLEPTTFAPPGEIRPTQIDFSETLSRTWAVFTDRWAPVLGGVLIVAAINIAASFLMQGIIAAIGAASQDPVVVLSVNIIIQLIYNVFAIWLGIGQQMFVLGVVRGEEPRYGLLFAGGPFLLPMILFSLLMAVILFFGLLLFVIPFFIFLLMFWQTQLLIIDRNMGVLDAMSLSRHVMVDNKLTVFLIWLVVAIVGFFAIILTCGVGYFGFLPYVMILNVVVYFGVTGQPTMADRYIMPPEQPGGTPFGQPVPGTPPDDSPFMS